MIFLRNQLEGNWSHGGTLFLEILIDSNSEQTERERERMVKKERINFATGPKISPEPKVRDLPMTMYL